MNEVEEDLSFLLSSITLWMDLILILVYSCSYRSIIITKTINLYILDASLVHMTSYSPILREPWFMQISTTGNIRNKYQFLWFLFGFYLSRVCSRYVFQANT